MDDRVAVITGGGSGIGAATARLLAKEGQTVALVGRRPDVVASVAGEIEADGGSAFAVPADLSSPEAPWEIVDAVIAQAGRVDVIVNNAASFNLELVQDVAPADFDDHIAVNLRAAYFLVQAALPSLRESAAGAVVNVSSAAAAMYRPRQTVYGLTKAALEHMTMNMAAELAHYRVRVNCVRPGPVATEIHTSVPDPEARLAQLGKMVPLGRLGEPEEVALWIRHLVALDAEWVTGVVLSVDGGRVLGPPEAL